MPWFRRHRRRDDKTRPPQSPSASSSDLAGDLYEKLRRGLITRDDAIGQLQAADPQLSAGAAAYHLNRPFYMIVREMQNKLRARMITREDAIAQIQAADPRLSIDVAGFHLDQHFKDIVQNLQNKLSEGIITRQEAIIQIQAADWDLTADAAAYFLDRETGPTIISRAKFPPES